MTIIESGLQSVFEKLERLRKEISSELSKCDEKQLRFKPSENEWSLLQVTDHLVQSEFLILIYIRKKMSDPDRLKNTGIKARLTNLLLLIALTLPVRYKKPKKVLEPDPEANKEMLLEKWETTRVEIKKLLNDTPPKQLNQLIFRHPVAGRFNMQQTLRFIYRHIRHHTGQVERIKNHPNFPA